MHSTEVKTNHAGQEYFVFEQCINSYDMMSDLGITLSTNYEYQQDHNAVITRGRRVTGVILYAFTTRNPKLLWPAFITYEKPIAKYSAIVCSREWKIK